MPHYSRFFDLREPQLAWDLPLASVQSVITIPSGEELHSITLPNASLCADFLVVEDIRLWAGVTVAVHQSDIARVKTGFLLTTDPMVRFISPAEAKLLPRYRDAEYRNKEDWWWLEVTWLRDQELRLVVTQTNGALWYCTVSNDGRPHVIVLALEGVDRMLTELDGVFEIPPI